MFDIILKGTGTKPMSVFHNSGRPPRDMTILRIFFGQSAMRHQIKLW